MNFTFKDVISTFIFSVVVVSLIWLLVSNFEVKDFTENTKDVQLKELPKSQTPTVTQPIKETAVPPEAKTVEETISRQYIGNFKLTAYCSCQKCCGVWATNRPKDENGKDIVFTASGTMAKAGRTIAVDPFVIPYGTEVYINGNTYVAEDSGGLIKGNRIDIYFDNHAEALKFGVQYADIYLKA